MSFTVTATTSGTGSANGMALDVRVVTGAALASNQAGATAGNDSSLTTDQLAITPSATGSWVYGSLVNGNGATAFTANGSTTFRANIADATNGVAYCTCRSTSTTTSGTPVTIGASAPTGQPAGTQVIALWEILKLGTLAEDASTPAVVSTTSAKTLTTAAFTPPAGSLLVALVAGDYSGSGADAVAMTDTSGLGLSWSKKSADPSYGISEIWVAQVPWTVTVTNPGSQTGTAGVAISPLTITGTDSGGLSLTWACSGLPTGLSCSSGGIVTGTPSAGGTFTVTATATDASGGTGSAVFTWTVTGASPPAFFDIPFAAPPLPLHPLDVRTEIYLNSAWVDTSAYTFMNSTGIQRGHPDESTQASPSSMGGILNNSDGRFSQLNPSSPYYPYLGLNTPMRVSIPDGSTHMRLELDQASGAYCASKTAFSSSSFEVWADADLDNWMMPQVLACIWNTTGNNRSWMLSVTAGGYLQFTWSTDGTLANTWTVKSTQPMPYPHGRISVKVRYNASAVSFYLGQNCASWIIWGSPTNNPAGGNPFPTATANLEVGCSLANADPGALTGLNGKVYAAAVVSGNLNTYASSLALLDFTAEPAGTTSWTDWQGNLIRFEGTAYVSDRNYRFHGQVSAWPQSWTPGGANATVAFSAGGKLRQMSQGNPPSLSPMRRFWTKAYPVTPGIQAYYPMEDAAGSTSFQPAIANGVNPMAFTGSPSLASSTAFAGSLPLPVTNSASYSLKLPSSISWASAFDMKLAFSEPAGGDANSANSPDIADVYSNGTIARLQLAYLNGGQFQVTAWNSAGGLVWGSTLSSSFVANGASNTIQVAMTQSGGNIVTFLNVMSQFGAYSTSSISVAGTIGSIQKVVVNPGGTAATTLVNATIGHLAIANQYTALSAMAVETLSSGLVMTPMNGWRYEPAGLRFWRTCLEEGIPFRGMGSMYDTTQMGAQQPDTAVNILQSCADADRGFWYEPRPVLGYGYRTRACTGNQTPALILDYQQDHLSDTLEPTHDDQVIKNDITVTNTGTGSSLTRVLNDGSPLSITIGDYANSYDLQLALDSQLSDETGWILAGTSVNEPRYTAINVDLANSLLASLWYEVLNVDAGDRVVILNPPAWLPPQKVDQIAQGFCEPLSLKDLKVAWQGIPTTPWNTALFDDPAYGHVDTDGSTTTGSLPALLAVDQTTQQGLGGWGTFLGSLAAGIPQVKQYDLDSLQWYSFTIAAGTFQHMEGPQLPNVAAFAGNTVAVSCVLYSPQTMNLAVGFKQNVSGTITDNVATGIVLQAGVVTPVTVLIPVSASATGLQFEVQVPAGAAGNVLWASSFASWVQAGTSYAINPNVVLPVTSAGIVWSTNGADYPFDLKVGGEVMAAISCATGASPAQTFCVARGINGVGNALASGLDVRLAVQPTFGM